MHFFGIVSITSLMHGMWITLSSVVTLWPSNHNAWNGECKILSSYNVNKSPLVFPVLRHIHPIYILSSYFFKMHLVLSFHLCVGFPNSLFPSGSPTKTLYIFVVSLICHVSQNFIILDLITQIIFGEGCKLKILIMQFSLAACYLINLRLNLEHPEPVFLSLLWDTKFHTQVKQQAKL